MFIYSMDIKYALVKKQLITIVINFAALKKGGGDSPMFAQISFKHIPCIPFSLVIKCTIFRIVK